MPKKKPEYNHEHFKTALTSLDKLTTVVKTAIHYESQIWKFLELSPLSADTVGMLTGNQFSKAIVLCGVLGLNQNMVSLLRDFNSIRNNYAHNMEYSLTDEIIEQYLDGCYPHLNKSTMICLKHLGIIKDHDHTEWQEKLGSLNKYTQFIVTLYALELELQHEVYSFSKDQASKGP
ncbi:hypothetical protein [Pseudoteredinibacter isoporae]|uniref:DUF4145 domain-containing protein n=1 Tax=Pseudoteredinibacter isoporae TaxID=570281 RepID=A0A7X0MX83_9GAMM|nr:hypothetical protein [Pseudoteredinibacter isoporae]MBB6523005.1 hypothetical protein [Pseudoteredinibacter isoporae]NHO88528.1 hypothetical protein [Pseudoteredinibacter isoporae]NIB22781.1 hypothetical protein [Pseudoteredinibacter isoporae]